MKFGRIDTKQAQGALLAHSLMVCGRKWKKGRHLTRTDIELLEHENFDTVVAAILEEDDIDEDTAAESLARVICGSNIEMRTPSTGRCNLYAKHHGILRLDQDRLNRINSIDEAFTVATLAPFARTYPNQLVASVKIMPFAVTRKQMQSCIGVAATGIQPVSVSKFANLSVSLIQTSVEWFNQRLLSKASKLLRERAKEVRCELNYESVCGHHENEIAQAVRDHLSRKPDIIFILGVSAIQDRNDVVPQGIINAGGRIEHFGMPVDPGNLILMARSGRTVILGLPGCSRSPKRNGFDIVFERLAADIEVVPSDIMSLGGGGLLMEGPRRPERRTTLSNPQKADTLSISAVVLAAGQSRRMGKANKLLTQIDGRSMIRTVIAEALRSKAQEVVVVTGHDAEPLREELADLTVKFAHNPEYAKGLSTSLRTALNAVSDNCAGVLICLGDMPFVNAKHIDALIGEFDTDSGKCICVPTYQGKRGNPVLWSMHYALEMMEVRGDAGAKHMIGDYGEFVRDVEMQDDGVIVDLDTPDAVKRYREMTGGDRLAASQAE